MTQCLVQPTQSLKLDLEHLNQQFAEADPKSILTWCLEHFPTGLIQSSALGASGMVIMDMLYRDLNPQPPVPVLFLDTLHHFPETLTLLQQVESHYALQLYVYRPLGGESAQQFAERYGDRLWETDSDRFHQLTKVEPLQRALQELAVTAWITGRRKDQAGHRSSLRVFDQDQQGRIKINPLANWDYKTVWKYTMEHHVPYNPLYDQGYTSIGDQPLTTPVQTGESERAGRWRGEARTECGIHNI
jgi:phosphoadenosine phosphosulfate reductase